VNLIFSQKSRDDIKSINDYLRDQADSETIERYIAKLVSACQELSMSPVRHRRYGKTRYHRMVHGNYLVFYEIVDEKLIVVVHIRHAARKPWAGR
jgi:addiction module RelE/StbE family toxin